MPSCIRRTKAGTAPGRHVVAACHTIEVLNTDIRVGTEVRGTEDLHDVALWVFERVVQAGFGAGPGTFSKWLELVYRRVWHLFRGRVRGVSSHATVRHASA